MLTQLEANDPVLPDSAMRTEDRSPQHPPSKCQDQAGENQGRVHPAQQETAGAEGGLRNHRDQGVLRPEAGQGGHHGRRQQQHHRAGDHRDGYHQAGDVPGWLQQG